MIEHNFDIPFIAGLALREKQIQQNYRPIIAVHKWFARRPGTLFRALLLSEFSSSTLKESFYKSNCLKGLTIADPFMGGGTPLLEANRMGCDVIGFDINPMAYWIVKEELEHIDLELYHRTALEIRDKLAQEIGIFYRTRCLCCGNDQAHVKYFLWVKVNKCLNCKQDIILFPGYLIAADRRHPKNVFICAKCGELTETECRDKPGFCRSCGEQLQLTGTARGNRCICGYCKTVNKFPDARMGPPKHKMVAIEYYCPNCKQTHRGRFFKKPDDQDMQKYTRVIGKWAKTRSRFVPESQIPPGDETDRLHRWGYQRYAEMFNERQLLALELACRMIHGQKEKRIKDALATNLSDLLRYQNMLCRYDTMALKSLDIFSIHGFPVGLLQCESNFLGIPNGKVGSAIGSGGWTNIIDKFFKAKSFANNPFEIRHFGARKAQVFTSDEWIGDRKNNSHQLEKRSIEIFCGNPAKDRIPDKKFDAVLTDPPYFGNVQYAELMDFCYVWLRKLVGEGNPTFATSSTRNPNELTGNVTMGRGIEHFTEGLAAVYKQMACHLKDGSPLAFTYHHNTIEAYLPIAVAILDANLTCSAAIPCPAEMGSSIHINGTGSSIIDTIFVCRSTGKIARRLIVDSAESLAKIVKEDIGKLMRANVRLSRGDIRCITYGHLVRLAIWFLRQDWKQTLPISKKLGKVADWINAFGGLSSVIFYLADEWNYSPGVQLSLSMEESTPYGGHYEDEIPF